MHLLKLMGHGVQSGLNVEERWIISFRPRDSNYFDFIIGNVGYVFVISWQIIKGIAKKWKYNMVIILLTRYWKFSNEKQ